MHIAFLTSEYPHSRSSTPAAGIGTSIKNNALALSKRGITVSVFIYDQNENAVFSEGGINYHIIEKQKYRYLGWFLHRKFLQNYINKFIKLDRIDAIEVPDWTGISAFISLQCPLVIRMNGSDTFFCSLENRPQKRKNFWFEKVALQGADHLLSVSEFTARETQRLFKLKRKITVIPNAVDTNVFQPISPHVETKKVLYFGSIIRKKGVLELARIFNEVILKDPYAILVIAGKDVIDRRTGRSTKSLMEETFTPTALKQVQWLGELSYEAIKFEIAQATVVVLPSYAEALPMTWIEAMAMEKALVTSDIGWAKEVMVDGQTGFTVFPEKHQDFADRIVRLLHDPELSQRMGKAARSRVLEKFSTDVVTQKNINFYKRVIRKST